MTSHFSVRLVLILAVTVVFAAALSAQSSTTTSTQSSTTCTQTQHSAPCQTPAPSCATCPTPSTNQTTSTSTGGGLGGELYVNAGGIWPTRIDTLNDNKIIAQGIYGLKGGIFFGPSFELEGSFGYLNHFQLRNSPNPFNINPAGNFGQPSVLGFLYDMNFAWNFGNRSLFGARFAPYVVFGGGGLTTEVRHGTSAFLTGGGFATSPEGLLINNPAPIHVISDGDTFFTVNYGGGIKAMNLWGPVGLRADVRGRTIPNFYHSSTTWPEVTGGVLFTFGER